MKSKKLVSKALALVLALVLSVGLLPIQASAATITFTDVPTGAWYYNDVHTLANKGVVSGVGNSKFNPEGNVAYCEMIKMVVNAFFRDKFAEYEAEEPGLWAYFGTQVYWYSFMAKYASDVGLLEGINVDIKSYADSYRPMTRYDMARILANTALTKGIEPTAEQMAAAQASIKDYTSIPDDCKNAVLTCFALTTKNASGQTVSLLNGHNGYFKGDSNMTRAEACAVIIRLDNLTTNGNGGTVVDPDPTPSVPTVSDIEVKHNDYTGVYTVADNGNPDGYLNNGKPITEENVVELLMKAETIWTAEMTWGDRNTANNNSYGNPSNIMTTMASATNTGTPQGLNVNYACGGYAAMISDYIFGKTHNNFHRVANISDIRPGDVIIEIKNSTGAVSHAFVAVSVPGGTYNQGTKTHEGYIHSTDGNNSGKVNWPDKYTAPTTQLASSGVTWQIWSRYPA